MCDANESVYSRCRYEILIECQMRPQVKTRVSSPMSALGAWDCDATDCEKKANRDAIRREWLCFIQEFGGLWE